MDGDMQDEPAYRHLAYTLASQGCTESTIRKALGVSNKEWASMLDTDPGLVSSIEQGRASGIQQVTEHLFNLARTTDKIEPIKYFLGLQDKEYRTDKAGIEVNNTILALPTMAEIRAIMAADPAMDHTLMIEGEVCENPRTGDDASGAAEGEMEE